MPIGEKKRTEQGLEKMCKINSNMPTKARKQQTIRRVTLEPYCRTPGSILWRLPAGAPDLQSGSLGSPSPWPNSKVQGLHVQGRDSGQASTCDAHIPQPLSSPLGFGVGFDTLVR